MGPRLSQDQGMNSSPFGSQTSGPSDFTAITSNPVLPPVTPSVPTVNSVWNGALFDPSDPALFNFDLASMNFGSHYGALEFGMLGHMATGVGDTPSDAGTQRGSVGQPGSDQFVNQIGSFNESPSGHQPFAYGGDTVMTDWPRNQSYFGLHKPEPPHAFAIESNAYFTSPDNSSDLKYEESPTMTNSMFKSSAHPGPAMGSNIQDGPHSTASHSRQPPQISTPQLKAKSQIAPKPTRRTRDPSAIYSIVTTPHPYTRGFHALIAYLQRRFSSTPAKTLAIAKSLASIRPSFIATTKTLKQDDLIFMEKCFQRTLWEYEGFIEGVGTPTIVARRTGEIAAVGKEFEILTGWNRRVLLGKAPNLNVNRGRSPGSSTTGGTGPTSGDNTTGRGTGINTPTQRHGAIGYDTDFEKHPQPVFLAELLDDDSVVTFYEDFARLAFGDSRGSVMGRVKLLKYQTQEDQIAQNLKREAENLRQNTGKQSIFQSPTEEFKSATNLRPPSISARKAGELKKEGISGEKGMQRLGSADGKVECSFCWTVKRDVFDIPMLIVMNVSIRHTRVRPQLTISSSFCPVYDIVSKGFETCCWSIWNEAGSSYHHRGHGQSAGNGVESRDRYLTWSQGS